MIKQSRRLMLLISACILFLSPYDEAGAMNFKELRQVYEGNDFYLQHNVWYRDKGEIHWFNYILAGEFIPLGSKVTITKMKTDKLKFRVEGIEDTFQIKLWNCQPSYEKIIGRIFGKTPPVITNVNDIDKKGISNGKVYEGMSRKGLFFAVGFPPYCSPSRNPGSSEVDKPVNTNLNSTEFIYWKNRFDKIIYYFDENDIVTNVRD